MKALFGIFSSIFVNSILSGNIQWGLIIGVIITLLFIIYDIFRSMRSINPNIKVSLLNDEVTQKEEARRGLVVFLSLFKKFPKEKNNAPFSIEELKKCIQEKDYKKLCIDDISATNFGPAIVAINAHKSKLEKLWIITTKATNPGGELTSLDYLPVFEEYIKKEIHFPHKIKILSGPKYSVDTTDSSQVTINTYKKIKDIYKQASKEYKIKRKELIVDVTGGFTYMSVGATLACLAKDQDVEALGSKYNPKTGNPAGGLYPLLIKYAPRFSKSED